MCCVAWLCNCFKNNYLKLWLSVYSIRTSSLAMAGQLPLSQPVSYYRPVHPYPYWKVVVHTVSGAREVRTWNQVPCRNGMSCRWARRGCRFQHEERDFAWKEIAGFYDLGLAQQCASKEQRSEAARPRRSRRSRSQGSRRRRRGREPVEPPEATAASATSRRSRARSTTPAPISIQLLTDKPDRGATRK